jgi:uncharacterized DUF497 family protein
MWVRTVIAATEEDPLCPTAEQPSGSTAMRMTYHDEKRAKTLIERGLDFAHADRIFSGTTLAIEDDREDYGEIRYQTVGKLGRSTVMVV